MNDKVLGVTLIELMVVIVILVIVITLGLPSLQNTIRSNRVIGQTNDLSSIIAFARTQAALGVDPIYVELNTSTDGWNASVLSSACTPHCELRSTAGTDVKLFLPDDQSTETLDFSSRGLLEGGSVDLALQSSSCTGPRQRGEIKILVSGNVQVDIAGCIDESNG